MTMRMSPNSTIIAAAASIIALLQALHVVASDPCCNPSLSPFRADHLSAFATLRRPLSQNQEASIARQLPRVQDTRACRLGGWGERHQKKSCVYLHDWTTFLSKRSYREDSTPLFLASNDDASNEVEDTNASPEKNDATSKIQAENKPKPKKEVPSPPRFLERSYNVAAILNLVAAIALISNAPTVVTTAASISTSSGAASATNVLARYNPNLMGTYMAGVLGHLFLAGGTCHILSDSVRTKRLFTSDTYKRLTMGTLLFGVGGLMSCPGEAGCNAFMSGGTFMITLLAKLVTTIVSFVGWEYGAGGFGSADQKMKNMLSEIGKGCRNVWKTLPVTEKRPPTFYRTFFIFLILENLFFNFPELAFNLKQGAGFFALPISLTVSSIARLGLLSAIVYVLKDAAERKRLEGTTFIKLNLFVGLWALGVGIAQGFTSGPFNLRQAADKFLFGILFLNNAVLSQLTKMGLISKRDEVDPDADSPLRIIL